MIYRGGSSYQVWLRDITSDTIYLDITQYMIRLEWARVASEVGSFSTVLSSNFPHEFLDLDAHLDWRVEIWRRADNYMPLRLENIGLLRRVTMQTDESGTTSFAISGPDIMHLLTRRTVFPNKLLCDYITSNYAADHMRSIVRTQLVTGIDNTFHISDSPWTNETVIRSLPTTCGWTFSVEPNTSTGDLITGAFEWKNYLGKNMMDCLRDIYSWSIDPLYTRTPLYFTIDFDDYNLWTFRVHPDLIGIDHSSDSGNPIFMGLDYGTLTIPVMDYNRISEVNACYTWSRVGGVDYIGNYAVVDQTRAKHSVINHMEISQESSTDAWREAPRANAEMFLTGRNYRKFTGKITNGPGCAYGRDWGFGDTVTVSFLGKQYDADIVGVRATLDQEGNEDMQTMLSIPPVR
jgi:hypothetical protein